MTCCLLISMYILDELSFDQYHENGDRIYRVVHAYQHGEDVNNLPSLVAEEFENFIKPSEGPGVEFGPCLGQSPFGYLPDIEITVGKCFVEPVQITLQSGFERHNKKY